MSFLTRIAPLFCFVASTAGAGRGMPPEYAACAGGDDAACLRLHGLVAAERQSAAALAKEVLKGQQRPPHNRWAFTRACERGDAAACSKIGDDYRRHDARQAQRYYRLACALSDRFLCNNLTLSGDALGDKISLRDFEAWCARGVAAHCFEAGTRLLAGRNIPADPARGALLLQRACDGGYGTACYNLAQIFLLGQHGQTASAAAYLTLLERGCKGGSPDACAYLKLPRFELEPACRAQDPGACALLERLKKLKP